MRSRLPIPGSGSSSSTHPAVGSSTRCVWATWTMVYGHCRPAWPQGQQCLRAMRVHHITTFPNCILSKYVLSPCQGALLCRKRPRASFTHVHLLLAAIQLCYGHIFPHHTHTHTSKKVTRGVLFTHQEAEGRRLRHPADTITEGIGINRQTANFERALVDGAFQGSDAEAVEMAAYLLRNDGLFVGSSAAMNCVGAVKAARLLGPGARVVTVLCDGGARHLSRFHNAGFLAERGLAPKATGTGLGFVCMGPYRPALGRASPVRAGDLVGA